MGFDIDAIKAHLPDRAICLWKNRSVVVGAHSGMRTERERMGKRNQGVQNDTPEIGYKILASQVPLLIRA